MENLKEQPLDIKSETKDIEIKIDTDDAASDDDEDLLVDLIEKNLSLVESKSKFTFVDGTVKYRYSSLISRELAKAIEISSKIIVMCGAGISTSAGIPDFRSPGTGLYANLQKYNLPYPEAIFDIDFFHENPRPFYTLAKELYPGSFKPTVTHHFIKILADKNKLLRCYTQNIDTLERVAGLESYHIVEAHGSFHAAHCISCSKEYSRDWVKNQIYVDDIPKCTSCASYVKPDIVFFGEDLPDQFYSLYPKDFPKADLLIVLGTSLTVRPFCSLIAEVSSKIPRILINMDKAGTTLPNGFNFSNKPRDVFIKGKCDDVVHELIDYLNWNDELKQVQKK